MCFRPGLCRQGGVGWGVGGWGWAHTDFLQSFFSNLLTLASGWWQKSCHCPHLLRQISHPVKQTRSHMVGGFSCERMEAAGWRQSPRPGDETPATGILGEGGQVISPIPLPQRPPHHHHHRQRLHVHPTWYGGGEAWVNSYGKELWHVGRRAPAPSNTGLKNRLVREGHSHDSSWIPVRQPDGVSSEVRQHRGQTVQRWRPGRVWNICVTSNEGMGKGTQRCAVLVHFCSIVTLWGIYYDLISQMN